MHFKEGLYLCQKGDDKFLERKSHVLFQIAKLVKIHCQL